MESGRILFDSSSSHAGHMVFLGDNASPVFRGARTFLGFEEGVKKRLPFFTTAEELLEEEYYDEQIPEKKRRLTTEQVHLLERSFETENKLEPERKSDLAKKLGLQPRQVAVWFQNRRARWKTKQLESDFDRLKSSYDSLVANRDSLIKDNNRLRSQVISLTEKVREKELHIGGLQLAERGGQEVNLELLSPSILPMPALHQQTGEDRLSTRSGESAILDGEAGALPLDSSGESYFQERLIEVGALKGGLGSEQDDGISDEGCSHLPSTGIFEEADNEDNWWVWS